MRRLSRCRRTDIEIAFQPAGVRAFGGLLSFAGDQGARSASEVERRGSLVRDSAQRSKSPHL
jgi:hypothetical protein